MGQIANQQFARAIALAAGELLNAGLGEAIEHLPETLQLQSVTVSEGALTLAGGRKP